MSFQIWSKNVKKFATQFYVEVPLVKFCIATSAISTYTVGCRGLVQLGVHVLIL